jgi:large subunit ribosomal protein L18
MDKKSARVRRSKRGRFTIKRLDVVRLSVHRTPRHIYAQIIAPTGSSVLAAASSLDKELRSSLSYTGNVNAAKEVGKLVAQRALAAGITKVAFDRSGFRYHGRIKALADAAREAGLDF